MDEVSDSDSDSATAAANKEGQRLKLDMDEQQKELKASAYEHDEHDVDFEGPKIDDDFSVVTPTEVPEEPSEDVKVEIEEEEPQTSLQ